MTRGKARLAAQEDRGLLESFLDMMSAERGASPNTLDAYRRDLLEFALSLGKRGKGLAKAAKDDVKRHLEALSDGGVLPSSQARKLSAMRRFYGFLYAEGMRRDDPCGAVSAPKLTRPLPKILSAQEAHALVEAARKQADGSQEGVRLLCIVELLYASGLRVSELVTLPLASRGIGAGVALGFARALGDFGATVMVAGNIPGQTQTLPIAVYDAVQAGDDTTARTGSLVLGAIAIVVLLLITQVFARRP